MRRLDANGDGDLEDAGDKSYYQLTDALFSVVCHVDSTTGQVRQWMSYDAYGTPKTLRTGDWDGNGTVTTSDATDFNAAIQQNPAPDSCDVNGDGFVDQFDSADFGAMWFESAPGQPTYVEPDEVRIAFAGYVRDPLTKHYLVRHRWYEPDAGRWLTRDPAGYVDGMSLYLYAKGNPLSLVDPTGLGGIDPDAYDNRKMAQEFYRTHPRPTINLQENYNTLVNGGAPMPLRVACGGMLLGAGALQGGGEFVGGVVSYPVQKAVQVGKHVISGEPGKAAMALLEIPREMKDGIVSAGEDVVSSVVGKDVRTGQELGLQERGRTFSRGGMGLATAVEGVRGVSGRSASGAEGLARLDDATTTVSRWGRPGLQPGDFVINGRTNGWNYLASGKWQPGLKNQYAPRASGQEYTIPRSSVRPPGEAATATWADKGPVGLVKYLMGRRSFNPKPKSPKKD